MASAKLKKRNRLLPVRCNAFKTIGEGIRRHRSQAGMSQEKLAEKADLHPVYIAKIERGEQWISLHALLRVAKAMDVKATNLIAELSFYLSFSIVSEATDVQQIPDAAARTIRSDFHIGFPGGGA
jgi:transcriptional regulator with XRE-family HTH domain